jgi:hypothetical protein
MAAYFILRKVIQHKSGITYYKWSKNMQKGSLLLKKGNLYSSFDLLTGCVRTPLSEEPELDDDDTGEGGGEDPETPAAFTALHVDGTSIKNTEGKVVQLHGINIGDPYHFYSSAGSSSSTVNWSLLKAETGSNMVRIACHPKFWNNNNSAATAFWLGKVTEALNENLYVILDYHSVEGPGTISGSYENLYDGTTQNCYDFWTWAKEQSVLKDGRILFELFNEPDVAGWTTGSIPLKPILQNCIDIIRGGGNTNIIIGSGINYTHTLASIKNSPLSDNNIAYAFHFYANEVSSTDTATTTLLNNTFINGLDDDYPIIMTEWGWEERSGQGDSATSSQITIYKNVLIPRVNSKNWHTVAWCYSIWYTPSMWTGGGTGSYSSHSLSEWGTYACDFIKNKNGVT